MKKEHLLCDLHQQLIIPVLPVRRLVLMTDCLAQFTKIRGAIWSKSCRRYFLVPDTNEMKLHR